MVFDPVEPAAGPCEMVSRAQPLNPRINGSIIGILVRGTGSVDPDVSKPALVFL